MSVIKTTHRKESPQRTCIKPTPAILVVLLTLSFLLSFLPAMADGEKTIVDSSGQVKTVAKPFTRIISLYSAHTENLCSLGAKEQLVGISRSDDYPPSVMDFPQFSYREDPEKFIALQPDLVLIRPMIERSYPQFINKLKQAGIAVISLQPNSVEEMFAYWHSLGILTGREAQAQEMITVFKSRLKVIQESLTNVPDNQRPKVYFQSIHHKMKTFAPESIGTFVLREAGGINIAADAKQVRGTNIAVFGKEQLLSRGPEIDIFLAQQGRMNPVDIDTIMGEPGFAAIKAVRDGQVFLIEEALVSRPTLRILDGIEQLNALFYRRHDKNLQSNL